MYDAIYTVHAASISILFEQAFINAVWRPIMYVERRWTPKVSADFFSFPVGYNKSEGWPVV